MGVFYRARNSSGVIEMPIARRINYRHLGVQAIAAALTTGLTLSVPVAGAATDPPDGSALWQRQISRTMRAAGQSDHARYQYEILAGELAITRDDRTTAARHYARAFALEPGDAIAERTARIAVAANQPALAYPAVRAWAEAHPDNFHAQRAAVRLAFVNGDVDGVAKYAPRLAAAATSPRAGYELVAELMSDQPEHAQQALAAAAAIARAHPDTPAAVYVQALTGFGYNDLEAAQSAVDRVIKQAPDWSRAGLLAAAIDVRQARFDAAEQRVNGLSGSPADKAQFHIALARYLLQAGKTEAGARQFKAALDLTPDNSDAQFGLGLVSLSDGDVDTAKKAFTQAAKDAGHADDAQFYLGVIAERQKQVAEALKHYARVTDGAHVFDAGVRRAYLISQQGDTDRALSVLDDLADSQTQRRADITAAKGDILLQAGQPKRALTLYNQALARDPQASDLLYGRSLVYERLGRIDQAEQDLRQVLSQNSEDARALNGLGYMLTNHSHDYARAESYIRKALTQDPDNPAVLDSLGWVQYRQGQLVKARGNLEKAYGTSSDPEIAAHLGAVRWAAGDHEAARRIWQKAAKAHPDNDVLKQMMEQHRS